MRWSAYAVIGALALALAACAQAPDGLLVVTGDPKDTLDPAQPATIDVIVGVDRGVPFAELTGTRAFVTNALPDDLDRVWADPSQPYSVLLEPFTSEVYVVMKGDQVGRRFGASLAAPVTYPGGLVTVTADVHGGGGRGVCPYGVAEDAGYVVEILPTDPGDAPFDCDRDGVDYPQDCVDYDEAIRPSVAYPESSGLELPEDRMCCNADVRKPALLITTSSGPASCSIGFGCANEDAFLLPRAIEWAVAAGLGGGDFCDCAEDRDPLDCLTAVNAAPAPGTDVHVAQPFCDLAVDDEGELCPGQVSTIRDRLGNLFPTSPVTCPVSIWWQTGPIGIAFRGQDSGVLTQTTEDCDADIVFLPLGPRQPVPGGTTLGWYIFEVTQVQANTTVLFPMHAHTNPVAGCERPPSCGFE
jgi:hypothetical protein